MSHTNLVCKSEYMTVRDGVRLAVTTWLPAGIEDYSNKYTAVLTTTRYWRATNLYQDNPEFQLYYLFACYLVEKGYVLVAADARGSGASFGRREGEYSPDEVEDIGELIEWVARQAWCDGSVATEGVSYTAQTALCSLVTAPSALKLVVCRAPDFDMYRHVFSPGGIANHWFIEAWGGATYAQDHNDVKGLYAGGYWAPPKECSPDNVMGVRPVDDDKDGSVLANAISEHKGNFNLSGRSEGLTFVDKKPFCNHYFLFEPIYQERIEKAQVPAVIRCGWHDAGTALGALSMFCSFSSPIRLMLGPWNHSGNIRVDPFSHDDEIDIEIMAPEQVFSPIVKSLDTMFRPNKSECGTKEGEFGIVKYYTLGENCWKSTRLWPLPQTQIRRLYLSPNHQLNTCRNNSSNGSDRYQVDPTATTGLNNRWHAQNSGKPILFPDRQEQDKKLLVYDSAPLDIDTEITGHPVVYLYVRSNSTDGQFFAYMETVDPDGRVRMLTEGQLRGLHRKVSVDTPPYRMFGPYHSLRERDAEPLVAGEVEEIFFDLFPISVLLKKGQRIRLAIAGADADVFAPIAGCEAPEITIERNSAYASCIDLPIIF